MFWKYTANLQKNTHAEVRFHFNNVSLEWKYCKTSFNRSNRRATRGREGGGLACTFLKIAKIALILEKKVLIVFVLGLNRPWVKLSIQNVFLRLFRKINRKLFPVELFFLLFLTKCLSKCPRSTKPPLPWNISWCVS